MDPERLAADCSQFEAELLRAGREDAMSEQSGRAILTALGVASPVAASGAVAVGGKLALLKGVFIAAGIGAAGTLAIWGGHELMKDPVLVPAVAPPVAAPAAPLQTIEAIDVGELPTTDTSATETDDEATPSDEPAPARRPSAAPTTTKLDTLPLELEAIDNARKALAQGNAALASRLLDRYSARFPKPRLGAEATVLRIETLIARGDRGAAARYGKAFLQNNPKSPYARRVRSLIGESAAGADASVGDR